MTATAAAMYSAGREPLVVAGVLPDVRAVEPGRCQRFGFVLRALDVRLECGLGLSGEPLPS